MRYTLLDPGEIPKFSGNSLAGLMELYEEKMFQMDVAAGCLDPLVRTRRPGELSDNMPHPDIIIHTDDIQAIMSEDGIVHALSGHETCCGLRWTSRLQFERDHMRSLLLSGWFGWLTLRTSDVSCLECLADGE